MKKRSGNPFLKGTAIAMVILSALTFVASASGIVFWGVALPQGKDVEDYVYQRLLNQYGCAYLDHLTDCLINGNGNAELTDTDLAYLEGGAIEYALRHYDKEKGVQYLYGDASLENDADWSMTGSEKYSYYYQLDSLESALFGYARNVWNGPSVYYQETDDGGFYYDENATQEERNVGISGIVYGLLENGKIYFAFDDGSYYPINSFTVLENGLETEDLEQNNDYVSLFHQYDGMEFFWNEEAKCYLDSGEEYAISLETLLEMSTIKEASYSLHESKTGFGFLITADSEYPLTHTSMETIQNGDLTQNYGVLGIECNYNNGIFTFYLLDKSETYESDTFVNNKEECYDVFLRINKEKISSLDVNGSLQGGCKDWFPQAYLLTSTFAGFKKMVYPIFFLSLLILIVSTGIMFCQAGHRPEDNEIHLRAVDQWPYLIYLCLAGAGVTIGVIGNVYLIYALGNGYFNIGATMALSLTCYAAWMLLLIAFLLSTAVRIKAKKFWRYSLLYYLVIPFRSLKRSADEKISLTWKFWLGILAISLLELVVIVSCGSETDVLCGLFLLFKVIEIPLLVLYTLQLKRLEQGGERIAAGDYSKPINTNKMFYHLKKHGENLNHVSDGISKAVEEQMKSERFKTELITNVSHDIKTPLTSIINYVDLMKKEDVTDPTLLEYMEVLDRQSNRLKKLIEDLMEASKASSGVLAVNMETIDAVVMLDQVIGEFGEKLEAQGLEVVVNKPEPPILINADGRHFWRILDNLLGNICKYAQAGTRVYIDMEKSGGWVQMTFRNISKEKLNISAEELLERFVRGDSSRNTEGHGLGLNIAESLAKLMGGNLHIEIDGDLFKVKVFFPEAV